MFSSKQIKILKNANLAAGLLHLALALSAIFTITLEGSVFVPVFDTNSLWNSTECETLFNKGTQVCPAPGKTGDKIGEVNFSLVLVISHLITSIFHFGLYWDNNDGVYIAMAQRGIKIFHWIEYTVTAALIAHVTLYFSGVLTIQGQILGYAAQSTLMFLGVLQDVLRDVMRKADLPPQLIRGIIAFSFVIGFGNVLSVWGPSLYKLWFTLSVAPSFVKFIVTAEFLLYTSFGFSQLIFFTPVLTRGEIIESYFFEEEIVLIVLSFISKATLASVFSVCLVYNQC